MKRKAAIVVVSLLVLAAPFAVLPTGWNRELGTLCLKETLVYGFALLGYYWLCSLLAGRIWQRLGADSSRGRFPSLMAAGVAIALLYTWLMTHWDWDLRYMWSACLPG